MIHPYTKKGDRKTNIRPFSVLPFYKKGFERVVYNKLGKYMDIFLNKLLRDLENPTILKMLSVGCYNDDRRNLVTLGQRAQYYRIFQTHVIAYLMI